MCYNIGPRKYSTCHFCAKHSSLSHPSVGDDERGKKFYTVDDRCFHSHSQTSHFSAKQVLVKTLEGKMAKQI